MLMTPLRDILGIGVPIILASTGRARSAEFTAAPSNEGALGSIELLNRASAAVMRDMEGGFPEPMKSDALVSSKI
jgi:NAD(P)H-dependent flavin oxidoreductase YrpB (nitropropane dioxygenase family)